MIRHDYIFLCLHVRVLMIHIPYLLINHRSVSCQSGCRGVEDAAPYDPRKDTFSIFGAYGDKIGTILAVIILIQTIMLPDWPLLVHFSFFHSPTANSSQRLFLGLEAWPLTQW